MERSLTQIADELRDLIDDLELIDLCDELEDDDELLGVVECLQLGLPHIEEKYGMHSNEAGAARRVIAKWTEPKKPR
jgi:hypothetical protein